MAYKKQKWMVYGSRGKIIEIKIKDEDDRILDSFKCNNEKAFEVIARIIRDKYGFNFNPETKNNHSHEEMAEGQI